MNQLDVGQEPRRLLLRPLSPMISTTCLELPPVGLTIFPTHHSNEVQRQIKGREDQRAVHKSLSRNKNSTVHKPPVRDDPFPSCRPTRPLPRLTRHTSKGTTITAGPTVERQQVIIKRGMALKKILEPPLTPPPPPRPAPLLPLSFFYPVVMSVSNKVKQA